MFLRGLSVLQGLESLKLHLPDPLVVVGVQLPGHTSFRRPSAMFPWLAWSSFLLMAAVVVSDLNFHISPVQQLKCVHEFSSFDDSPPS